MDFCPCKSCKRRNLDNAPTVQVATEGDAFTIAFHEPIDAVAWAITMQQVRQSKLINQPTNPVHTSRQMHVLPCLREECGSAKLADYLPYHD